LERGSDLKFIYTRQLNRYLLKHSNLIFTAVKDAVPAVEDIAKHAAASE
jgi:hypothetical protein